MESLDNEIIKRIQAEVEKYKVLATTSKAQQEIARIDQQLPLVTGELGIASLSTSKTGLRTIQFVDTDSKRKSIRLGKTTKRQAESVKLHIERLVSAKITGHNVQDETSRWVAEVAASSGKLVDDLAKFGLIKQSVKKREHSLGEFIDSYIKEFSPTVKPNTVITWNQCRRLLLEKFGGEMKLSDFTAGHAIRFRNHLLTRGNERVGKKNLAETTVRKRCSCAKQFFSHAVALELITKNPFDSKKIPTNSFKAEQKTFVSLGQSYSIIERLPDAQWRLLFAFARFAGLRIPSEPQRLNWSDVDWDNQTILVSAPKTEHHKGHETRTIPIFSKLMPYLRDCWDVAEPGEHMVLPMLRGRSNTFCRKPVLAAIQAAGVSPWDKLFTTLRACCDTELRESFPGHVVDVWIGHNERVAKRNYLQITNTFSGRFAEPAAKAVQNPVQHLLATRRREQQKRVAIRRTHRALPHRATQCRLMQINQWG